MGRPHTVVLAEALSTGAVVRGVRRGRSWLAESREVELAFRVSGPAGTATCGGQVEASPADTVRVRLDVSGVPDCVATVRGVPGVLATAAADASGRVRVDQEVPAALTSFVRAEVRRPLGDVPTDPTTGTPGGAMVALTNPVFVGTLATP